MQATSQALAGFPNSFRVQGGTQVSDRCGPTPRLLTPRLLTPFTGPILLEALRKADYPKVRFWTRKDWDLHERSNKSVMDVESAAPLRALRGKARAALGENVMTLYVEDADGNVIDGYRAKDMRKHAREVFELLREEGRAPAQWSQVDLASANYYRNEMATKFLELRLCESHWKADKIATVVYPSWIKRPPSEKNADVMSRASEAPSRASEAPSRASEAPSRASDAPSRVDAIKKRVSDWAKPAPSGKRMKVTVTAVAVGPPPTSASEPRERRATVGVPAFQPTSMSTLDNGARQDRASSAVQLVSKLGCHHEGLSDQCTFVC